MIMDVFRHQVAGHMNKKSTPCMIKHNNTILKPVLKQVYFQRELQFYEDLFSERMNGNRLRCLVPRYYGHMEIPIDEDSDEDQKNNNNDGMRTVRKTCNCIILEDLTNDFKEPCIIDIKIGRRTWDPNANHAKILKETNKYADSKKTVSFCIPGFQVFDISHAGKQERYDKNYGKQLNKQTIRLAIKTFLNGDTILCRSLVLQILASLWEIQHWARTQHEFLLYSSSILIVYDARVLRKFFSDRTYNVYKKMWVHVKMIDFAHVFINQSGDSIDENYLDGVENLIAVFETFLPHSI